MTHSASLANSARSFCSRESFRKGHAMPQTDNLQIDSRNQRTSSTTFVPPTFQLPAGEDE